MQMRYSGEVFLGGKNYRVKRAFANVAAGTVDANIVSAVAGKRIFALAIALLAGDTATDLTFNSKPVGAGTPISMEFQNAAYGGAVLPNNDDGWFNTLPGEGLTVTTGAGSTVGVMVNYIERV